MRPIILAALSLAVLTSACGESLPQPTSTATPSETPRLSATSPIIATTLTSDSSASSTPLPSASHIFVYSSGTLGFLFEYPPSYTVASLKEKEYSPEYAADLGFPDGTRRLTLELQGPQDQTLLLDVDGGPYGFETSRRILTEDFLIGEATVHKDLSFISLEETPVTPSPSDHYVVTYKYKNQGHYFFWIGRMIGPDEATEAIFDQIVKSFRPYQ